MLSEEYTQNNPSYALNCNCQCPVCGGVLRPAKGKILALRCWDCAQIYAAVDTGHADSILEYVKIAI